MDTPYLLTWSEISSVGQFQEGGRGASWEPILLPDSSWNCAKWRLACIRAVCERHKTNNLRMLVTLRKRAGGEKLATNWEIRFEWSLATSCLYLLGQNIRSWEDGCWQVSFSFIRIIFPEFIVLRLSFKFCVDSFISQRADGIKDQWR